MHATKRFGVLAAVVGLVAVGVTAMPGKAEAWWRGGGFCCGVGFGFYVPPVVIAPPVYYAPPVYAAPPVAYAPPQAYYAPPQASYAPPQRQWVPGHYEGAYWVAGHWA